MGMLVEGRWVDRWYDTKKTGGRFVRSTSAFRAAVEAAPDARHPPVAGRYHLYVAAACPWAHRTLVVRALHGLEDAISVSVVHPDMLDQGWSFDPDHPDHLFGLDHLHQVYTRADPTYTGRVTVPALWDREAGTIVNNESAELIRMLDGPLAPLGRPDAFLAGVSLYPEALREAIDAVNAEVYDHVNNGVYKCGFATTQAAYDEAATALFRTLDALEVRLERQPWLAGERFTEADVRLFTTCLRFDLVYHHHFKCTVARLRDYPQLWDHTRTIHQLPGVAETVDVAAIRRHYFASHPSVNPHRIVPLAPRIDLDAPTRRQVDDRALGRA